MLENPSGIGDTQFGVKARLRDEREGSRLPAMSVVFYFEAPTGSTRKQIGSGLTDYWLYGVLQKSLTRRTTGRLNGGVLFARNSSTGVVGIRAARGQVFTGNGSLVRDFTPKLKLGIEVFGGVTTNFNLPAVNSKVKSEGVTWSRTTSRSPSEYSQVSFRQVRASESISASLTISIDRNRNVPKYNGVSLKDCHLR
jgi:hypothetical protein